MHLKPICNRRIIGMFCDAYILMAALSLWIPSKKFVQSLDSHEVLRRSASGMEIEFSVLKNLSEEINHAFGDMVVHFMLECILVCSFSMNVFVKEVMAEYPDWKRLLYYSFYLSQFNLTFLISAKISSQVIRCWKIFYVYDKFDFIVL